MENRDDFENVHMYNSGIWSKHSNVSITQESAVYQFLYKLCPIQKKVWHKRCAASYVNEYKPTVNYQDTLK
jgi:hypothetical protein